MLRSAPSTRRLAWVAKFSQGQLMVEYHAQKYIEQYIPHQCVIKLAT